jgi:hypothetical protein
MKIIEFSIAQLPVAAGQLLGLMLANFFAGFIANSFQSNPQHAPANTQKYANSLYYCAGIILALVACIGQKLYLAAPFHPKHAALSLAEGIKAAILSSGTIILLATLIYFSSRRSAYPIFQLFSSGLIESMLSVAGMLLSLLPFILVGFARIPLLKEKSVKISSLITFFLIISGIYSLLQDGFVSFTGSKIAKLYFLLSST